MVHRRSSLIVGVEGNQMINCLFHIGWLHHTCSQIWSISQLQFLCVHLFMIPICLGLPIIDYAIHALNEPNIATLFAYNSLVYQTSWENITSHDFGNINHWIVINLFVKKLSSKKLQLTNTYWDYLNQHPLVHHPLENPLWPGFFFFFFSPPISGYWKFCKFFHQN